MTFVPIPHVVDEQLIQTLWGNTVADNLAYLKTQVDAMTTARAGMAQGLLGHVAVTSPQNGIGTTPTDIAGMTLTITPPASRKLRVEIISAFFFTGGNSFNVMITVDGVQVQTLILTKATNDFATIHGYVVVNSTGNAMTFKARAYTSVSTVNVNSSATYPSLLTVTDIGKV